MIFRFVFVPKGKKRVDYDFKKTDMYLTSRLTRATPMET